MYLNLIFSLQSPDDDEPEVYNTQRRSSSCPDLTIYRPSSEPARKRAQSLFYHVDDEADFLSNLKGMHRVQSDGDLTKVDRNRAFDESNMQLQPTELLARVFTALGNIKAADDEAQSNAAMGGGFHGLSDSQILASEKQSNWSLPFSESSYAVPPLKARGRAASEFRAPMPDQLELSNSHSHEWTWSGNNQQIEEFMRLKKLNKKRSSDLYRAALTSPKVENPVVNMEEGMAAQATRPPGRASSPSIFGRFNPFKKRDDSRKMSLIPNDRLDVKNYLDHTSAGRHSRISVPSFANVAPATRRRTSTFSIMSTTDEGSADVLENTTIADLIRALEVMHTQAVAGDDSLLETLLDNPRQRFGSSSTINGLPQNIQQQPQQSIPPPLINIFPPASPTQSQTPRNRRSSMRPLSTSNTPLFHRSNRRQSTIVDLPSTRRSSLFVPSSLGPPPYSEATPRTTHRRFSVRPTLLSIPPGQSPMPSIQATSTLQRRLSRPNPQLTDYNNFNLRPNRFGRSAAGSNNHSVSPLETSPIINRSGGLAPVTEIRRSNVPPQDDTPSQPYLVSSTDANTNPDTDINRRRSES